MTGGALGTNSDAKEWSSGAGAKFAWNYHWSVPKPFKVWWQLITDDKLYDASGAYPKDGEMFDPFDEYTTKKSRPGSIWCEGNIEIRHPALERNPSRLVLHFYPNGTVDGDIEYSGLMSSMNISERHELPVLKDSPRCIKEIPNPYYGKKKPIRIN